MKNVKIPRRSFLLGLGAASSALLLSACGSTDAPASSASTSVLPQPDSGAPASSAASEVPPEPILRVNEFPITDGSTACIPLIAQIMADTTGMDLEEAQSIISVSTTAYAWESFGLYNTDTKMLVVYEAPDSVKEELEAANVQLEQKPIGVDALVFIVNENNPVKSLTRQQLKDIYAGKITNWKDVGGNDAEIVLIGREAGSGTRDGFESITDTKDACQYRQELTSTGDVITTVSQNPNAIGYASLAAIKDSVKALTVNGVAPTEATVKDGTYLVQRPFVLVTKEGVALSETAQKFFDFATSADAASIISAAGAVPVA